MVPRRPVRESNPSPSGRQPDMQTATPTGQGSRRVLTTPVELSSAAGRGERRELHPFLQCHRLVLYCVSDAHHGWERRDSNPQSAKAPRFYGPVRLTVVAALPSGGEGGTRTHAPREGRTVFGTAQHACCRPHRGFRATKNPLSSGTVGWSSLISQQKGLQSGGPPSPAHRQ